MKVFMLPTNNTNNAGGQQDMAGNFSDFQRQGTGLRADARQNAIFNSTNFSSIAAGEKGVIRIFSVNAKRMPGYAAFKAVNQLAPADISDSEELIVQAVNARNAMNAKGSRTIQLQKVDRVPADPARERRSGDF